MERAFAKLDAAGFLVIWQHFDADDNGYIEGKELDEFFRHMIKKLGSQKTTEHDVQKLKQRLMSTYDVTADGKLQIQELAHMLLAADENFLLLFRREVGLNNSVDFMKNKTGALEGVEVDGFVKDMMELVRPSISGQELDKLKAVLLGHCDVNNDGKIQKNELCLCLGVRPRP
ncbi:hypothetical protein CRUP_001520 [Coryphaenoides rupestris]|nr:hypothetical protein CRUP_001520 [Coryphaenoides rupestris]